MSHFEQRKIGLIRKKEVAEAAKIHTDCSGNNENAGANNRPWLP